MSLDDNAAAPGLDYAGNRLRADSDAADLRQLLDSVFERYGLDFREYAYSSLKRRVMRRVAEEGTQTIGGLRERVLSDEPSMHRLLVALTVHVTAMFRDAGFFKVFRREALPILRTHPFIRLWVAGCSTGEEVYSLAILLHEEGLYERCRIYATDVSEAVLGKARTGIFPLSMMQQYTRNYQSAGGQRDFSEYYTADSRSVAFHPHLHENVVFAVHNLVSDASFNEFHVIFCRNVMIYFNRALQERAQRLLFDSLATFGYLGLGRSETVRFSTYEQHYEAVCGKQRLYRKIA